jgi:hypothetical protein
MPLVLGAVACGGDDDSRDSRSAGTTASSTTDPASKSGNPKPDRWELTVYYTPVERYHHGPARRVTGCPVLDCERGHDDLGSYPDDFVEAVRTEGSGRISRGSHAGRYLNWSYDVGFWLDTDARDTTGAVLRPWSSAAADHSTLPAGTSFRVAGCGRQDDGSEVPASLCRRFRGATWSIVDEFTPGLGGPGHVDLYIGEETGPDFTDSAVYTTLVGAQIHRL